jgi:hypothetical protein
MPSAVGTLSSSMRPELDAVISGVAAGSEKKPAPVRQETRIEVFGLLSGRIELGDRTNLAADIRNSKQYLSGPGREDDETVLAPGPACGQPCARDATAAERLRLGAQEVHFLQRRALDEADKPAVG